MTALAHKIRDVFSDFGLEFELWWARTFKRKSKPAPTPLASALQAKPPQIASVKTPAPQASASPVPAAVKISSAAPLPTPKTTAALKPAVKEKPKVAKMPLGLRLLRLTTKGRLLFFDQLATLVGSGVPLIEALNVIRAQTKNKNLRAMHDEMIHRINAGAGFSEALALFPHLFPSMQRALVEAGEKSGNLALVLGAIAEDLETSQDFLRKVKGAMFYPVLLVFLAIILVTGMMIFVIPRVAKMYDQAKVELPALTQAVIKVSNFLQNQWMILIGGIVVGFVLLWLLLSKTRPGRLAWEKFVTAFPLFGTIAKEKNLMIIAGNMAMLMQSGVLISEAFEITQKTVDNLHYQRALEHIRHGVVMGRTVSESMGLKDIQNKNFKEDKLFPLQFSQLVHIGETTGRISQMLAKLRDNYHKSIDYKLKNISVMIEPLMIFVVAALVGSILLAVMLPFFYIGTTIK